MKNHTPLPFTHPPKELPVLKPGEVHLWCVLLESGGVLIQKMRSLLSSAELDRAGSFRFDRDRNRYLVAHGCLRILLGKYLNSDPVSILFQISKFGKPQLASGHIQFNLAHSGKLALYGFSLDRTIGVDVERIRPVPEAADIIKRLFSEREMRIFTTSPQADSQTTFAQLWTRGEALVKAFGQGFGENVGPISRGRVMLGNRRWEIKSLSPYPGYCGAVAVEGKLRNIFCWILPVSQVLESKILSVVR